MYLLAELLPAVRKFRMPFTRDQVMLLMAAINEFFLGIDHYIAHSTNGTITPAQWIPIIFGPAAGIVLLISGLIAFRRRPLATVLATFTFLASIGVGLLGTYFHLAFSLLPQAPAGQRVTLDLLVWAPPLFGPLYSVLIGVLGISAAWIENPIGSGRLDLLAGRKITLPYSKTRAYLFMVGIGSMMTLLSSVIDHSHTNFSNPWLWLPTLAGIFGTVVAISLGMIESPSRSDLAVFALTMLAYIPIGLVGFALHIENNLAGGNAIVIDRFLHGSPFLAPLLYANIGMLGLITLMDPCEEEKETDEFPAGSQVQTAIT
jgi:hypothetical protein